MLENYSTVNDQPWGTKSNGYDGLDTEFVYNKSRVVGQAARLQKWVNDGVAQIAGQGLSPEQLFTSGKCATYLRLDRGARQHRARSQDQVERHLPAARGRPHRAQQQHRRRHAVGDEGPQVRGVRRGGGLPGVRRQPRPAALVAQGDGLRADHQQGLPDRQGRRATTRINPTREIAILQLNRGTPTPNSQGFHFGNYTQTTFALREEMESVFANKKTPQQGLDDAVRRGNDLLRQFEKLNAGKY